MLLSASVERVDVSCMRDFFVTPWGMSQNIKLLPDILVVATSKKVQLLATLLLASEP